MSPDLLSASSAPAAGPSPSASSAGGQSLVSRSGERALTRQVVVRRLLAVDEAGQLSSVHARIAAETAGVSVRTVWRWLAEARETGRVETAPRRKGFMVSDELWDRLSELGGNVAALHRELTAQTASNPGQESAGLVPSLGTLHRVVQRERQAGRVLQGVRPGRGRVDPVVYDRALTELALPGTVDEAGAAPRATAPRRVAVPDSSAAPSGTAAAVPLGARLYVPGAHVVATSQLGEITEALAHTIAARQIACVYGDAGQGKTVAVHQALRLLPRRVPVRQAQVAVKPALPQLRAALLTAFGLPATALTNRTDAADRALIDAFKTPGVLLVDDVQRIAAPELDYLRLLADAPTTQMSRAVRGRRRTHSRPIPGLGVAGADLAARPPSGGLPGSRRAAPVPSVVAYRGRRRSAARGRDLRTGELPDLGEDHLPRLRRP
ncbi:hypothetical protein GCM10010495_69540 [Kitasatospora herbaricolor]|uniref:ATP-binding protein n=1 Tax=Kitasatospora herbaricolor TaxID=68217 RepID=UPI001749E017|nr:ATP-binding protein [Kitasatospora herbaricolor]MDQ0313332.1 hypothetical protein [Kitasatospora herbaricolor]GGV41990.1 hypothetical protein GCM10010495_69540 [Kitasatospora herbaricolor]